MCLGGALKHLTAAAPLRQLVPGADAVCQSLSPAALRGPASSFRHSPCSLQQGPGWVPRRAHCCLPEVPEVRWPSFSLGATPDSTPFQHEMKTSKADGWQKEKGDKVQPVPRAPHTCSTPCLSDRGPSLSSPVSHLSTPGRTLAGRVWG